MTERNRDPGSPLEPEGLPETADDDTPEREGVPEPQQIPTATEKPVVVTDFGTTADEQVRGDSLERRLTWEEPDVFDDDPLGVDEQGEGDGLDDYEREPGQLVEDDEGVREDAEKDAIAHEAVGSEGLSAEERALRVEPEGGHTGYRT